MLAAVVSAVVLARSSEVAVASARPCFTAFSVRARSFCIKRAVQRKNPPPSTQTKQHIYNEYCRAMNCCATSAYVLSPTAREPEMWSDICKREGVKLKLDTTQYSQK